MSNSFEDRYYLTNPGLWQRTRRNITLYEESLAFLLLWITQGRKVRRALEQAERDGECLELDKLFEGPGQ